MILSEMIGWFISCTCSLTMQLLICCLMGILWSMPMTTKHVPIASLSEHHMPNMIIH